MKTAAASATAAAIMLPLSECALHLYVVMRCEKHVPYHFAFKFDSL